MKIEKILVDPKQTVQLDCLPIRAVQKFNLPMGQGGQQRTKTTVHCWERLKMHLTVFCSFSSVTFCGFILITHQIIDLQLGWLAIVDWAYAICRSPFGFAAN